jgi:hypothetical protein
VEEVQIFEKLNVKTDSTNDEKITIPERRKHRSAARKENARKLAATASVENVVLRALSVRANISTKNNIESRNDQLHPLSV